MYSLFFSYIYTCQQNQKSRKKCRTLQFHNFCDCAVIIKQIKLNWYYPQFKKKISDKSKFRSSSPNKRPSSCPSSIIKIWIHPEGEPRAIKLKADITKVEDLDDLASIITKEINVLEYVDPQELVFLDKENRSLHSDTYIQLLEEPLVVRYPLSDTV